MRSRVLTVPPELDGARLDRVLTALLGVSRTRVQELIGDGGVALEGHPEPRSSLPVEAGWEIRILDVTRSRTRAGGAEHGELVVLHEDEHVVVVDKPAGVVTHPSSIVRGGTISELAVQRYGRLPSPQGEDRPGIVHRLDADTSGVLVLARSELAASRLMEAFRERTVEKRYEAIVFGVPRFDSDWIEAPIGRAQGRADRMSTGVAPERARAARTYYETLERFRGFGHVTCHPETGRTHQIRVHLASIDHPILGDRVYRGRRGLGRMVPRGAPPVRRHFLHAAALGFAHPADGRPMRFEAPLPPEFEAWLAYLRGGVADPG